MRVLTVENIHTLGPAPPDLANGRGYTSYFEGTSGDQWVYASSDGIETLYGGDNDWRAASPQDVVLDRSERAWLAACRIATEAVGDEK